MTLPTISIRLILWTDRGPVGGRLERGTPLPTYDFNFDDTPEGREKAELARRQMQEYVDKYNVPKSGKKL